MTFNYIYERINDWKPPKCGERHKPKDSKGLANCKQLKFMPTYVVAK